MTYQAQVVFRLAAKSGAADGCRRGRRWAGNETLRAAVCEFPDPTPAGLDGVGGKPAVYEPERGNGYFAAEIEAMLAACLLWERKQAPVHSRNHSVSRTGVGLGDSEDFVRFERQPGAELAVRR